MVLRFYLAVMAISTWHLLRLRINEDEVFSMAYGFAEKILLDVCRHAWFSAGLPAFQI